MSSRGQTKIMDDAEVGNLKSECFAQLGQCHGSYLDFQDPGIR